MSNGMDFFGSDLNDFAINLFRNSGAASESVCVSPASVALTLAMIFYGSGGETKAQIRQALFGSSLKDSQVEPHLQKLATALYEKDASVVLDIANRLYSAKKFDILPSYKQAIQKYLQASIVPVNFSNAVPAVAEINHWVEESTHGKITEIVSADTLDPDTRLLALNAIYFKSQWMNVFPEEATKKESFYSSANEMSEVDMMTQKDQFLYGENDECQILTLKYVSDSVAMKIILPKERFGLEKLEKSLNGEKLRTLRSSLRRLEVTVELPKFKLESDVKLKNALEHIGITDLFTGRADLSGITGVSDLYVSSAKHKTFIEVNEKGTEAAAVTGFEMIPLSLVIQEKPLFFVADHPFMFIIENFPNGVILFVGRYTGPK